MFGSLGIGICDLFVIWCLKFVIFSNFILSELVSHLSGNVETFSHLSLTAMEAYPLGDETRNLLNYHRISRNYNKLVQKNSLIVSEMTRSEA